MRPSKNTASKQRPFLERLAELQLPADQCVVVGSGLMDVLGLRQADDIDLCISRTLFDELVSDDRWSLETKQGQPYVRRGDCEAWLAWDANDVTPNFEELMADGNTIGGYHFVALKRLLRWKQTMRRPKDLPDIKLIEEYLESN